MAMFDRIQNLEPVTGNNNLITLLSTKSCGQQCDSNLNDYNLISM